MLDLVSLRAVSALRTLPRTVAPILACLLACTVVPAGASGQATTDEAGEGPGEPEPRPAAAPVTYDPTVPVGAVRSYIDACRAGDYAKAAGYLNLDTIPDGERAARGPELARRLKIVLDRKLWVHYERLSAEPSGNLEDGLAPNLERIPGSDEVQLFLERLPDAELGAVWKFSASTVGRIPALYERHGYGGLGELLPPAMFEIRLFEIQLWQWLGLLLLVLLAYPVARLLAWIGHRIAHPFVRRTATDVDDRLLRTVLPPARLALAVLVFTLGSYLLRLSVPAYERLWGVEKALAVVAVTWLALRLVDVASAVVKERLERADNQSATAVLPLGRRVVKAFLLAIAVLAALQNVGFNVTGLIAGLGVGGLAIALAAQKSVANLFGGFSLVADQPIRVGDFCRFGGSNSGTVEEIGLRSTRVRTLDRTLVTIPNSEFSEIQLENFAARDKMRLATTLGLRYETTPDQLRYVLAGLRRLLLSHPRVEAEPCRARFVGFGASSLDLEVFAYVATGDWAEFLEVREDLYLRMMDLVEEAGAGFAFPSQTLYVGRDQRPDGERTREAERRVAEWRERGELPFPDYAPEAIAGFRGTADYPPSGSAVGGGAAGA